MLSLKELLAYIKNPQDLDLTPYADLLHQLEAMGDPGQPSKEHARVLRWVGEALYHYEQRFPVEEPLASTIRKLKPLAACMALTETDFMQPDVHPLHQFLDAIQARAVGWQASLGRAGTNLQRQVETAVNDALRWFEDESTDIAAVCSEFLDTAERDRTRATKMCQRVIDTESGKSRTAAARAVATKMINGLLDEFLLPRDIAEFVRGPWYDSAQLLLLKSGANSEEWQQMSATTRALLESVQNFNEADEDYRQEMYARIAKLPKDMRRWLLSLHHDTASVNDAMATIESVHMRVLRKQALELFRVEPVGGKGLRSVESQPFTDGLDFLEQWHWFAIDTYKGGEVRAQLIYKNNGEQRLVFANLAGIKVLEYSFADFDQLMSRKRVTALPIDAAFSLCLMISAGIDTMDRLQAMYAEVNQRGVNIDPAKNTSARSKASGQTALEPELTPEEERGLYALIDNPQAGSATGGDGQRPADAGEMVVEEIDAQEQPKADPMSSDTGGEKLALADGPDAAHTPDDAPVERSYFGGGGGGGESESHTPAAEVSSRIAALPLGTWLKFREEEEHIEGELKSYDALSDTHTFCSHGGKVIRQLTTADLQTLVMHGLVEAI